MIKKIQYNKYLVFFLKIIILLIIAVIIDQIGGKIFGHFYFKQKTGAFSRTNYAIDSTQAELLVFGSSRANHHYVPEVFENHLKMSFYNTGRDGNYLLCNYAVFKAILMRYSPKIVLFEINPNELNSIKAGYDELASLLPYYKKHPEIRNIIEMRSPYEKYKLLSAIYPYNSCLLNICIGNLELKKFRIEDRKGFVPLKNILTNTNLTIRKEPYTGSLDTNKVNALKDIIHLCNKNNIQLIFIQSPMYAKVLQNRTIDLFEQLVKDNNTTFWNFANNPDFLAAPNYFADQTHLNENGAIYFSQIIAKRISINDSN